jgi:hypothetical protein
MKSLQEILDNFKKSEIANITQTKLESSVIKRKKLYQFDLNGKLIKSWNSGSDARKNGFNDITIKRGLKSNPTTFSDNFVWSYSEKIDISNIKTNRKYKLGEIVVTDLDGNILSICKSTKEVSVKFGVHQGNVRRVLNGQHKQARNYKFYFKKNLVVSE